MLRDAANHGGIVHMWFHPHNFITAPRMRDLFIEIIRYAGELTRSGGLLNLTISESVAHLHLSSMS